MSAGTVRFSRVPDLALHGPGSNELPHPAYTTSDIDLLFTLKDFK